MAEPWFWARNLRIDIRETVPYDPLPGDDAERERTQPTAEDIALALQPFRNITDHGMQWNNIARVSYSRESRDEQLPREDAWDLEARAKRIKSEEGGSLWEKIAWDETDEWYEIDPGFSAKYLRWSGKGELDYDTGVARRWFVELEKARQQLDLPRDVTRFTFSSFETAPLDTWT